MPRRSKKAYVKLTSNKLKSQGLIKDGGSEIQVDNKDPESEIVNKETSVQNIVNEIQIIYHKRILAHFHQGDSQFSEQSRGFQCSCNALAMLCCAPDISHAMTSNDLDLILKNGDQLYKDTCQDLHAAGRFVNEYLNTEELPTKCTIGNTSYTIRCESERYGSLDGNPNSVFETLDIELQAAFTVSNTNILIFPPYMMAIYYYEATGQYIFFDSHSRDEFGFPTSEGAAVALYFENIQSLYLYLSVLAEKLHLRVRRFLIHPLSINVNQHDTNEDNATIDVENEPGCSTQPNYTNLSPTSKNEIALGFMVNVSRHEQCRPINSRLSRYQKWFQNLSTEQKENLRSRKRKQWINHYEIPENAKRKQQKARKQSKASYQIPANAKKKRQKARKQSKASYQIPENAKRKRQQARKQSKASYEIPENAKRKRQQARKQSKASYEIPENAKRKRQQARKQSKASYEIPENADRKRRQSKASYTIHENAERKKQKVQSNRFKKTSNIDIVIENFKKTCNENQLTYICQICNRVFFKQQVTSFYRDSYNHSILLKIIPPKPTVEDLPASGDNNKNLWICKTCHGNISSSKPTVPTLATVNNLGLKNQPHQLSELNILEKHLISPAILFMKMIPLIKGAQKGINGQVVCVKSNVNSTAQCLPRLPTEQSLVRVKLKRKLEYKGHHMCQDISPFKVKQALLWLKENNPEYENIDINFNDFDTLLDDQLISNNEQLHDDNILEVSIDSDDTQSGSHSDISTTDIHKSDNDSNQYNNVTNTSAPQYSFLHPVDFAQYLADKHDESILSVAPGEGNIPEKVLQMEAKCFPTEFPDGSNTYNEKREKRLSPSRYFNSRIFSADNRFARNPEYIFFALYATEVHQIHNNVSVALRIGSTKTSDGREITASMLQNHNEVQNLIKRDAGYRFLTQIRGTPAFWEKSKRDVFAMIRQLGMPTFFVTFSAADRRWIEIDNTILIAQGKQPMTEEQHKNMSWEDHCDIIMSNPAIAAKMFQIRVRTLINDVILSPAKPIGNVEDYYYRTEFQQRGWPHIHMILWVKDAPVLDRDSDDDITKFIDKYISCELPPESDEELREIVQSTQLHSKNHTKSCKKRNVDCRFNFPRPPSSRTFICRPVGPIEGNEKDPEYQEAFMKRTEKKVKATETLGKIKQILVQGNDLEFEQILQAENMTQSGFEEMLDLVAKKKTLYLKRQIQEKWINNYNPHLLRCWNGNMDIQYCLDPYSVVVYMLSYLTKSEREMGDLLKNAQREAREGNMDAVSELRKLGSVYLQHREVSVMNAIYLVCSMPLKNSSRNVVFLQTDLNGQKISLPLKQLKANAGNSEQVWMKTHIEKYIGRPNTAKYNEMCMATFFSTHYQVSNNMNENLNEVIDETDENAENVICNQIKPHPNTPITLANCSIKMKKRSKGKPAVIRYPRVSVKRDSEGYHKNMLRLYLPHRRKILRPSNYATYEQYHLDGYESINGKMVRVRDIVKQNMSEFEPDTEEFDEAWNALQNAVDIQDAWALINPQGEQQQLDNRLETNRFDDSDDDYADIEIPEFSQVRNNNLPRCAIETCRPEITEEQAEILMQQLNEKQRHLFNHVAKWCNNKVTDHTLLPFHIFLTGGAGTGKSHVIKCIKYYAHKTFASTTESSDDITVLLLAHTGTAAFNISGETICSALKISAKSPKDYRPLGEQCLNTLRVKFQHLKLVIIDEISMVSATQLSYIHGRLQQIKGTSNSSFFGNVSILAVGDFYQLPPISPPTPLCFPHEEILKDLWNPLFQIVELTQIMRQRDDAVFAQMLNRLRIRPITEPLEKTDEELLKSRIVKEHGLNAPSDALHLFYLNKDVDEHNEKKLTSLESETFIIKANDVDQRDGRIIKIHETPHNTTRKDDTSLASNLKLAVGARTMLIANVDVSDGLCNGVSGIIKGIEFCNSQNMPTAVYVKFDSARIGTIAKTTEFIPPHYAGCVPIKPRKESFQLKGKTFTTTREQIPLKLAWAVTIHKVQGQTTDQAVISLKGLKTAMAYVALSRVTHLDGIYLMDFKDSNIFCNPHIAANLSLMPICDLSKANPLTEIDNNTYFIVAHHNIPSLQRHIEDLKKNREIRKAHVICLSETWITDESNLDYFSIEGYSLELIKSQHGRGVAMYIQNGIEYSVLPFITTDCDVLVIRTHGKTNLLVAVIYKPVATNIRSFSTEINDITSQIELLDTKYTVLIGDFNRNLFKETVLPVFSNYNQLITDSTTTKGTLLDHIYIKPQPNEYLASVMTTYYSYHNPIFVAIRY